MRRAIDNDGWAHFEVFLTNSIAPAWPVLRRPKLRGKRLRTGDKVHGRPLEKMTPGRWAPGRGAPDAGRAGRGTPYAGRRRAGTRDGGPRAPRR